jgi:hypothetical protein
MQVDDGLFRGSAPSQLEVEKLKSDFGVKRIVSLDKKESDRLADICNKLGIEHIDASIEHHNLDKSLDYLDKHVVDLLSENPNVFVHCLHGKDRTGTAVAMYRVRAQGWSPQDALQEALRYDFGSGVHPKVRNKYCKLILDSKPELFDEIDHQSVSDSRSRQRQVRKMVLEDMNDSMAQVGLYDGVSSIMRSMPGLPALNYTGTHPYGAGYIL